MTSSTIGKVGSLSNSTLPVGRVTPRKRNPIIAIKALKTSPNIHLLKFIPEASFFLFY